MKSVVKLMKSANYGVKNKMTTEEFRKLVKDHAKAWARVGGSAPGLVIDVYHQEYIKDGIALMQKLFDAWDEKS